MNYLHKEFDLMTGDVVEVTLDSQANVLLLDSTNYMAYQTGKSYSYFGGYAEKSPVKLIVPRDGKWHIVVNLGGYAGRVKAGVRLL